MPIPFPFNPLGKELIPDYFSLEIQPGIIDTGMVFSFTPYWNDGGCCKVSWGDGTKEEAVTSGTALSHTYTTAGTYTVKIISECYQVNFNGTGCTLITACSDDLTKLGALTNATKMFQGCTNAKLTFNALPETLVIGDHMFDQCTSATLNISSLPSGLTSAYAMFFNCSASDFTISKLPAGLTTAYSMFYNCTKAVMNLNTLVANAGTAWSALKNITYMFYGCTNVTGSRSAFLANCTGVIDQYEPFNGTNTTA